MKVAAQHFPRVTNSRVSDTTKELLEKRRTLKREGNLKIEYSVLCKLIRRKLKEDHESYRCRKMIEAVKRKKSLKKCKRELLMFKPSLAGLKDEKGRRTEDRTEMEEICRKFYTNLFASKMEVKAPTNCQRQHRAPPSPHQ